MNRILKYALWAVLAVGLFVAALYGLIHVVFTQLEPLIP